MDHLKNIPNMDEILKHPEVAALIAQVRRDMVVSAARAVVAQLRAQLIKRPQTIPKTVMLEEVVKLIKTRISALTTGTLQEVVNGTGVVLHTNLGRAPLAESALEEIQGLAACYTNLELDLQSGERGSRYRHLEELLITLTGAEAALVVNNNAAAVLLGLNTMAAGREVIVSRGQLVEIGGAFRIPEVMKASGARLVEVGTTNKTYPGDFLEAIRPETALLFSAHTSNYRIVGFTREATLAEMVQAGRQAGLPVMHDLGSGVLFDLSPWGLKEEPTVQASINAGADVVTFSGDKLLGGPQAGIIVGKKTYIDAMKKNQLLRALRVDKLTIAALEGTLKTYLTAEPQLLVPVLRMLTVSAEELEQSSFRLCSQLQEAIGDHPQVVSIMTVALEDRVGGGAYPIHSLPGFGVEIAFKSRLETIARLLRESRPALLARMQDNCLLISVRTLRAGDLQQVAGLLQQTLHRLGMEDKTGAPEGLKER